jgi:hypothetical protein
VGEWIDSPLTHVADVVAHGFGRPVPRGHEAESAAVAHGGRQRRRRGAAAQRRLNYWMLEPIEGETGRFARGFQIT